MDIDSSNDVRLANHRVILRNLTLGDIPSLGRLIQEDPDLHPYSLEPLSSFEDLEMYIYRALDLKEQGVAYPFVIFDQLRQEYVGSTRYYAINLQHKSLEIGYTWYAKHVRRTGLNKHVKYLMLSHAFEVWGMQRVVFRVDANNNASLYSLKNIGATVEDILRNDLIKPDGTYRDTVILSILYENWFKSIKNNLFHQCMKSDTTLV
jgi:RimJ/RimL family protein N-acetyltransferase